MDFRLPNPNRNSLIEEIFLKATIAIITISLSTVLIRTLSKLFETSSVCNSKRSSALSMLQAIMSFKKIWNYLQQQQCCHLVLYWLFGLMKIETIHSYYHYNGKMLPTYFVFFHYWELLFGLQHFDYFLFLTSKYFKSNNPVLHLSSVCSLCWTAHVWYEWFLAYCKKLLQFIGTSMLIIAAPLNIVVLMLGPTFGLVKFPGRMHPVMLDFLIAGRELACSNKGGG